MRRQEQNFPILRWAKDDRPREKLRAKGVEILSDAELLAILLHNGTRDRTAVDLGRELLVQSKHSLKELGRQSLKEMMKIKGIGEAKAITILAALELGRRRHAMENLEKPVISGSASVATYLQTLFCDYEQIGRAHV